MGEQGGITQGRNWLVRGGGLTLCVESCTSAHGNRMTATTRVERACRRLPPGGGTQSMSFNRALCVCVCVCVCVGVCECVPPSSTASLLPELLWITVRPSPTSRSTRPPCTDHWYREIVQLAINCQTNLLHKLVKQMVSLYLQVEALCSSAYLVVWYTKEREHPVKGV